MKGKIINKQGGVSVIDYDKEINNIENRYQELLTSNGVSDGVINIILNKTEEDRTIDDNKKIILRHQIEDWKKSNISKYDDYQDIEVEEYNKTVPEYYILIPEFKQGDGVLIEYYDCVLDRSLIKKNISDYKQQLSDTDYIITKTYEAKLSGDTAPYTDEEIKDVVSNRKVLRDKINELEKLLN